MDIMKSLVLMHFSGRIFQVTILLSTMRFRVRGIVVALVGVVIDKSVRMVESEDTLERRVEYGSTMVKLVRMVEVGDDGGGPDVVGICGRRRTRGWL